MWLVLAHACGLVGLQLWTIWRLRRDRLLSLCAVFVLAWTNIVVTALLLSCVSALGSHPAYVGTSLALALVFGLAARSSFSPEPVPTAAYEEATGRRALVLRLCLWVFIGAMVLPTAALCLGYDPDNYDSVAYRLPRAFLYVSQGSLRQLGQADFRMQFYPFNMTLAYLASSIGGLAGPTLNAFGFLAWLVGGAAAARTAREFGATRTAALFAAAAYLSAPAVLVSASSTNDDMIAGVPLLIGLLFLARWWRSCSLLDALLAAMGFGLSAGSKLHFPFFGLIALLFAAVVAGRWLVRRTPIQHIGRRVAHTFVAVLVAGALGLPALVVNYVETGHATPALENYQNKPFSLVAAATTSAVSSASLFLAPLPDLDLDPNQNRRKALYDAFNTVQNRTLFSWVSPRLNYSNEPYYRFEGVASSDAYQGLWEQSAWLGFTPWLLLAIPVIAWARRKQPRTPAQDRFRAAALWLALAFFGWHLARCAILKYVGAAGIYYAYPMAIAVPALSWLWDVGGGMTARILCYALLATNLIGAINGFLYNQQRNIPELRAAKHFRPRQDIVDASLAAHLRAAQNVLVAYTQWELPLLDVITAHPGAHYKMVHALTAAPVPGYDLSVMLNRQNVDYGEAPFQFANDDRTRLSYLGSMKTVWGDQWAFGHDSHGGGDPQSLAAAAGETASNTVFDYRAGQGAFAGVLAAGWAPTDPRHHWSDGPESRISFYLPKESGGCVLEGSAISSGDQTIKPSLNGAPLDAFELEAKKPPGKDFRIPLPDAALQRGATNNVLFRYGRLQPIGEWKVALGIVRATLRCDKLQRAPGETLPPLQPEGFAVLQFTETRDARGGLTGLTLASLNGVDPSEAFLVSVDRVSGEATKADPPKPSPLVWNKTIDIPGAPTDGYLRIVLTRADRPQTSARFYLPVARGSTLELDTRRLPTGLAPS